MVAKGVFKKGRPPKYPWDEWTNGQIHTAHKGRDFKCQIDSFTKILWDHGYKTGLKCELQREGASVRFRFFKEQAK